MKRFRVYVDTSVFGGTEDDEFLGPSRAFFDRVKQGRFLVLTSELVVRELGRAPDNVRAVFDTLPEGAVESVAISKDVTDLASAYIKAGALGEASRSDAIHVAAATIAGADLIVSWNFKHIVNFGRIKQFNGVSSLHGYAPIDIRSPLEVAYDDKEDEKI